MLHQRRRSRDSRRKYWAAVGWAHDDERGGQRTGDPLGVVIYQINQGKGFSLPAGFRGWPRSHSLFLPRFASTLAEARKGGVRRDASTLWGEFDRDCRIVVGRI